MQSPTAAIKTSTPTVDGSVAAGSVRVPHWSLLKNWLFVVVTWTGKQDEVAALTS